MSLKADRATELRHNKIEISDKRCTLHCALSALFDITLTLTASPILPCVRARFVALSIRIVIALTVLIEMRYASTITNWSKIVFDSRLRQ